MKRLTGILTSFALAWSSVFGQNAKTSEIVPGNNLVVDGVPKIPASVAVGVSCYRNSYGYPLAGWDPAKRELWLKVLASTEPGYLASTSLEVCLAR